MTNDDPFGDESDPNTWVKVSLKGGTNYDAPMVQYTAQTPGGVLVLMKDPDNPELLALTADHGHTFSAAYKPVNGPAGKPASGGGSATASHPVRSDKVYQAPNGRTAPCRHSANGLMEYKTGPQKKDPSKKWQAFMCDGPANSPDKCDPIWL